MTAHALCRTSGEEGRRKLHIFFLHEAKEYELDTLRNPRPHLHPDLFHGTCSSNAILSDASRGGGVPRSVSREVSSEGVEVFAASGLYYAAAVRDARAYLRVARHRSR